MNSLFDSCKKRYFIVRDSRDKDAFAVVVLPDVTGMPGKPRKHPLFRVEKLSAGVTSASVEHNTSGNWDSVRVHIEYKLDHDASSLGRLAPPGKTAEVVLEEVEEAEALTAAVMGNFDLFETESYYISDDTKWGVRLKVHYIGKLPAGGGKPRKRVTLSPHRKRT